MIGAEDFLDGGAAGPGLSADAFLGDVSGPAVTQRPRRAVSRGNAYRPASKAESVLQLPGVAEAFAAAPDPRANAEALWNALQTNPNAAKSPMYRAGAAAIEQARSREPTPVQAAMHRHEREQRMRQQQEREIAAARETTDQAFGGPLTQAIAAPARRLASGAASVVGGVASVPQLFGSDLGRETAEAAHIMARAHMPEDPSIADEVLAGAGQILPMIGGATALRAALTPLLGEAAATALATSASGAAGGAMSGGEVLRDLEHRTDLTEQEKQRRAGLAALFSGVTGMYADRLMIPGADRAAGSVLLAGGRAFLGEGAQETLDQMGQNLATDRPLGEGALRAGLVGGIVGGGTRVSTEVGGNAYQLAQALNADATALANQPAPPTAWAPSEPRTARPLAAPAPGPAAAPLALPYDPQVPAGPDIMIAGQEGPARPMTAAEFLEAEDARQHALDTGLTPDVRRAQESRTEATERPAAPVRVPPDLVQRLMAAGWTPPKDTADQQNGSASRETEAATDELGKPGARAADVLRDLEALYQQDVKGEIRGRLGLPPPPQADDTGAGVMADTLPGTEDVGQSIVGTAEASPSGVPADLQQIAQSINFDTSGMDAPRVGAALARIRRRLLRALERQQHVDVREEARLEQDAMRTEQAGPAADLEALDVPWLDAENVTLADAMIALGVDPGETETYAPREEANHRGTRPAHDAAGWSAPRPGAADEGSSGRPAQAGGSEGLPGTAATEVAFVRSAATGQVDQQRHSAGANPVFRRNPALLSVPSGRTESDVVQVRAELGQRFGDLIGRLERRGFLRLWDTPEAAVGSGQQSLASTDRGAQGLFVDGVAHLFADRIEPGTAVGVLLHEVGEHQSMQAMLGQHRYAELLARAQRLLEAGDTTAQAAAARVPQHTASTQADSELLAYMVEEAANAERPSTGVRQWLADALSALKAWFFRSGFAQQLARYGVRIELTPQDIAALAEQAVRWRAHRDGPAADAGAPQESRPRPVQNPAQAAAAVFDGPANRAPLPAAGGPKQASQGQQGQQPPPGGAQPAQNLGAQPWNVAEPGTWDNVVRTLQNSKVDLKRVHDSVEQRFGRIPDAKDAYLAEELYHGKVAARVEKLHREYVEPILRKIAIAGRNAGVTLDDINVYLHARHAPERNAAMAAINPNMPNNQALSGMSDADAAQALHQLRAAGKEPALKAIAKDVDELLADTRTALVADGLEDAGVVQAWEQAYRHYVPLMRDIDEGPAKGSGFSVRGPEAKRAVGSNRQVTNILANVVTQAETAAIRAEKAGVGRTLLEMARAYPNPDFWKVDTPPTKPRINPATGLVERSAVDPLFQTADNVVMVKDYGAVRFIVFNQQNERAVQVARAMKNLEVQQVPRALQYVGMATRFMSSLLTQRNPEFWFTNLARDLQGAAIQMSGTDAEGLQAKVAANLLKAMAGMRHLARGTGTQTQWARYAQELKDAGGTTGYMQMFENSNARMKDLQREVARMQQGAADPRRLARQVLEFIDDYNDVIENGVRLAVFQAARDAGVSTERAASIAKNITVNFNRKGNATPWVNSLYMFFNAGLQGSARLAQALATSGKARAVVGAMAGAAFVMDIVNRALAGDDEETKRNR